MHKLAFTTFQPEQMSLPTSGTANLEELESRLLDIESDVTNTRLQIEDVHNVLGLTGIKSDKCKDLS